MANTPLHVAAGHNSVEVVKFLLNMAGPETVELEAKNMVCKIFIRFDYSYTLFMIFTSKNGNLLSCYI